MTPWTAAHQASPSFAISWRTLKLMSIESVMPSNPLILCHPFFLLPSTFSSIRISTVPGIILSSLCKQKTMPASQSSVQTAVKSHYLAPWLWVYRIKSMTVLLIWVILKAKDTGHLGSGFKDGGCVSLMLSPEGS